MIEQKDMPPEYTYDAEDRRWVSPHGLTMAWVDDDMSGGVFATVQGPTRSRGDRPEADLLRMVWALQEGHDPRVLKAEVADLRGTLEQTRATLIENRATWQAHVRLLETSDAANERRWRNEEAAKRQIMAYRDDERARADAAEQEVATLRDRLERTEAALQYDRERLAAQTVMIGEQQRVIDHLRRPLSARVVARVTGWVRG